MSNRDNEVNQKDGAVLKTTSRSSEAGTPGSDHFGVSSQQGGLLSEKKLSGRTSGPYGLGSRPNGGLGLLTPR
jgi:hypothetical protein